MAPHRAKHYDSICVQDRLLDLAKKIDRLQDESLIELAECVVKGYAEKDNILQRRAASSLDKDTDFIWG